MVFSIKIFFLSKLSPNILVLIIIIAFAYSINRNSMRLVYLQVLIFNCLCANVGIILPPLTNALFYIHPPMLYLTCTLVVMGLNAWKQNGGYSIAIIFLFITLLLGGIWAMQELSWGGWWNWDVLEVGILYCGSLALLTIHLSRKRCITDRTLQSLRIALVFITYIILNKMGVGVSIHSFVTSNGLRCKYAIVILFIFTTLSCYMNYFTINYLILSIIGAILYITIHTYDALKTLVLLCILYGWLRLPKLVWVGYCLHLIQMYASMAGVLLNYNNIAFFIRDFITSYVCEGQTNHWFHTVKVIKENDDITKCHTNTYLSKPRVHLSTSLSFSQFRSNSEAGVLQIYRK